MKSKKVLLVIVDAMLVALSFSAQAQQPAKPDSMRRPMMGAGHGMMDDAMMERMAAQARG